MTASISSAQLVAKLRETVEARVDVQMAGPLASQVAILVADGMTVAEIRSTLIERTLRKMEGAL